MCSHAGDFLRVLWWIFEHLLDPFFRKASPTSNRIWGGHFFMEKLAAFFFWIVSVKLNLKPETIHAVVIFRKTGTFPENSHPRKLKTRAWFFRSSGPKKLLEHNTWTTLALLWIVYIFWCLRKKHWDTSSLTWIFRINVWSKTGHHLGGWA